MCIFNQIKIAIAFREITELPHAFIYGARVDPVLETNIYGARVYPVLKTNYFLIKLIIVWCKHVCILCPRPAGWETLDTTWCSNTNKTIG